MLIEWAREKRALKFSAVQWSSTVCTHVHIVLWTYIQKQRLAQQKGVGSKANFHASYVTADEVS
jgi:hypothetical protein